MVCRAVLEVGYLLCAVHSPLSTDESSCSVVRKGGGGNSKIPDWLQRAILEAGVIGLPKVIG